MRCVVLLFVLAIMVVSCTPTTPVPPAFTQTQPIATAIPFALSSSAFSEGQAIPIDYSCKGADISPALTWTEPPAGTQSFAIIMDDPQASWVHWILYNIPASTRGLKEGLSTDAKLNDGSLQMTTSFGKPGYGGPCPPAKHNYIFTLYAMDTMLTIPSDARKDGLLKAMEGHTLASVKLTGTFAP
jgi:Raf kinase inhibitor-like YbhB/YbcL family protein